MTQKAINERPDDILTEWVKDIDQATVDQIGLGRIIYGQATAFLDLGERAALQHFVESSDARVLKENIAGREAEIYIDVCSALDDNDKPKFSNDGARKAEANRIAAQDADLQKMRGHARMNDIRLMQLQTRVARINGEIELRKAFLSLGWK